VSPNKGTSVEAANQTKPGEKKSSEKPRWTGLLLCCCCGKAEDVRGKTGATHSQIEKSF
jgi:hypothetical protein